MKALDLLKKNQTTAERADAVIASVKRDVYKEYIEALLLKKERLEDEIADLKTFNLETNHNSGKIGLSKTDVKTQFMSLLKTEYELELTKKELEYKGSIYMNYFDSVPSLELPQANTAASSFESLDDNK